MKRNHNCVLWCVVGDFNSVRNGDERSGLGSGVVNGREIVGVNDFIERNEFYDIPMVGRKFTWLRPNGKAMSRLDRALVTEEWLVHWPGTR